jgi:hypothetical protein
MRDVYSKLFRPEWLMRYSAARLSSDAFSGFGRLDHEVRVVKQRERERERERECVCVCACVCMRVCVSEFVYMCLCTVSAIEQQRIEQQCF